jgi:ribosomal protein S18 acetylase RimI-like enzyme
MARRPPPTPQATRRRPSYETRPLDASTWDAFAELVERNNGVYGGCWCIAFHSEYQRGVSDPRTLKEELVRAGRAHAALVFDEANLAQGWCQYGSPEELGLKHNREYAKDPPPRARWRITCIFVDKGHRGRGVARAGLEGALTQIAAGGGGLVEAISEATAGREAQGRFLFSATAELFERYGFTRGRQVGKHAWIVSREIDPA